MKKFLWIILFLFVTQSSVFAKSIDFAIVSDVHLIPSKHSYLFTPSEKKLIFTVDSINRKEDIKFVVFLGDCIEKSNIESLQSFMNIVQNLNKPYYLVYGNHDAYSAGGIEKEEFAAFVHEYNKRQPQKDTSFYFKANGDSYGLVADGSSYVLPNQHGRYLPELLNEIEKLFKYKKNKMIFIFQHFPIIAPNDNEALCTLDTEKYLDLISKYNNIVLIASGHFHDKNKITDKNEIYHISAPALKTGSGSYEIIKIDYNKKLFNKPKNIKVQITDVEI